MAEGRPKTGVFENFLSEIQNKLLKRAGRFSWIRFTFAVFKMR